MTDMLPAVGRLTAALALVGLNGFFVASEFAFVRVRSTAVDQLVAEGAAGAETLRGVLDRLDDYLAATQLGITIASLALGWVGEPAVAALLEPVLGQFLPEGSVHAIAVAVGFGVITFLHVVYGELAPKTLSIASPERIAILVAPPMKLFYYLFMPALVFFNGTANKSTSLFGVPPASETDETLSEEELRRSLSTAHEHGKVDADEATMIEQVFELDDRTAREIMIPRPDVALVTADTPLAELREDVAETGHTRYPVVDASTGEQPVGYLDVKDILRVSEEGSEAVTAGDLAREAPVVPESMAADALFEELRGAERQMAIVIDEWGTLEGIATVEDVVEVVVGDIRDEYDDATAEPSIEPDGDGYAADGAVPISTVNEALGLDLAAGAYGTLGGLVLDRIGRTPEPDDEITVEGYRFTVTAVDDNRIERIAIDDASRAADGAGDGTDREN
ncbi:cobalt transporter [Halobacteriales archaeon QH_10_67_13]|nr:MAG: cobalt transporter [Halobacteriales archaeon QH_10_67_13]